MEYSRLVKTTNITPMSTSEIDELLHSLRRNNQEKRTWKDPQPYELISKREISKKITDASNDIEDMYKHIGDGGGIPITEIQEAILPTIRQAAEIPYIYHLLYELNSKDEYTYRHTVSVGIIATLIGKWMKLAPQDMANLTLGATLHDIGKAKVPSEILHKPGRLTKEEYEEIKLHTVYGYDLIKEVKTIDRQVALMALQHHEREDGKGYPLGLQKSQVTTLSKVVAIADVFHAMSSSRVYHQALPFYLVIKQMQDGAFGEFDPAIMLVFLNKFMNSLVGKSVELSEGSIGTILMVYPHEPLRCLLKIEDQIIDLRHNPHLHITNIIEDEK